MFFLPICPWALIWSLRLSVKPRKLQAKDYEITLSETHHVHKKDAPSGTAKTMAEIAEQFSKIKVKEIESIREGRSYRRPYYYF